MLIYIMFHPTTALNIKDSIMYANCSLFHSDVLLQDVYRQKCLQQYSTKNNSLENKVDFDYDPSGTHSDDYKL